jgi:DNA-binding NtrC family response regulator
LRPRPCARWATTGSLLLDHFRRHYAAQTQQQPFRLSPAAAALVLGYPFPGNVRELRNIVIRLTTRHSGQLVDSTALEAELDLPDDLPGVHQFSPADEEATGDAIIAAAMHRLRQKDPFSLDRLLDATERGYIEAALKLAHGNVSQAARLLGIHRTTLYNRMEATAREP